MAGQFKTFSQPGTFEAMGAAEQLLEAAGFSVGSTERGNPRGIMFGSHSIAKWRNLNGRERAQLDGHLTGDMREGPVTIEIFESAPQEARRKFHDACTALAKAEGRS